MLQEIVNPSDVNPKYNDLFKVVVIIISVVNAFAYCEHIYASCCIAYALKEKQSRVTTRP